MSSGGGEPGGTAAAVEAYLLRRIPLSQALGARVVEAGPERIRLAAPLTPNLNHRGTAFGGSLSALAILAGWSLVWVRLRAEPVEHHVVIAENSIVYTAPAEADFTATCTAPGADAWGRFFRALRQRGRARVELEAEVRTGALVVATFRGRYVALRGEEGGAGGGR